MSIIKCAPGSSANLTRAPSSINSSTGPILAPLHTLVGGSLAFALAFPFVVAHLRVLPLEPTGAVLVGSLLMLTFGVLTQADIYTILGTIHIFYFSGSSVIKISRKYSHMFSCTSFSTIS